MRYLGIFGLLWEMIEPQTHRGWVMLLACVAGFTAAVLVWAPMPRALPEPRAKGVERRVKEKPRVVVLKDGETYHSTGGRRWR